MSIVPKPDVMDLVVTTVNFRFITMMAHSTTVPTMTITKTISPVRAKMASGTIAMASTIVATRFMPWTIPLTVLQVFNIVFKCLIVLFGQVMSTSSTSSMSKGI